MRIVPQVIRTRVEEYSIKKLFVERVHWHDLSAGAFRASPIAAREIQLVDRAEEKKRAPFSTLIACDSALNFH